MMLNQKMSAEDMWFLQLFYWLYDWPLGLWMFNFFSLQSQYGYFQNGSDTFKKYQYQCFFWLDMFKYLNK